MILYPAIPLIAAPLVRAVEDDAVDEHDVARWPSASPAFVSTPPIIKHNHNDNETLFGYSRLYRQTGRSLSALASTATVCTKGLFLSVELVTR